jgi:hypothetical protein
MIVMANPVNILLLAGIGLALMYAVVSFTSPPGTSGAFIFAAGAGAGLFALVVVLLAAVGLWQSHAYRKM